MFDLFDQVGKVRPTQCKTISELRDWIRDSDCKKCQLCKTRFKICPGRGSGLSGLMIVGQGPGINENKAGEPFVGSSGAYMSNTFDKCGGSLELLEAAIENVTMCWGGRSAVTGNDIRPSIPQVDTCFEFLKLSINLIKPKMILVFGDVAWNKILKTRKDDRILPYTFYPDKFVLSGRTIPVYTSYHPARIIRIKGKAYSEFEGGIKTALRRFHECLNMRS